MESDSIQLHDLRYFLEQLYENEPPSQDRYLFWQWSVRVNTLEREIKLLEYLLRNTIT
jgi:hypothetical protein